MSKRKDSDDLLEYLKHPEKKILEVLKEDTDDMKKLLKKYDDIDYDSICADDINELNELMEEVNYNKKFYKKELSDIKSGEEDYGDKTEKVIKKIKEFLSLNAQAEGIFRDILDFIFPNGQREAAYVEDYDDYSDDYSED